MTALTPDQYTAHRIDWLYRAEAERVLVWEDDESVRAPGWFRAQCHECAWETSGTKNTVDDAVREHVGAHPLGRLLEAVSDAVRERGVKLAGLPDVLGEIWAGEEDHPAQTGGAAAASGAQSADVLTAAVRTELVNLWADLENATRESAAPVDAWSIRQVDLLDRIKALSDLVGPASWRDISIPFLLSETYRAACERVGYPIAASDAELAEQRDWWTAQVTGRR